jgi:hypothetical protein
VIVLIRNAILLATLVLFTTAKSLAAEPVVDGGELVGATGVAALGNFYDVKFVDGTCIGLFSNCDNAIEDFAFSNPSEVGRAGYALLEQVFIDNGFDFGSKPELTQGCESSTNCQVLIPVSTLPGINTWAAVNDGGECCDRSLLLDVRPETDTTDFDDMVYAVFSLAGKAKTKVALKFSEVAEGEYKYVGKIRQLKTPERCWADREVKIFHDENSNKRRNKGERVIGKGTTNEFGRYRLRSKVAPPPGDTVSVIIKRNENCKAGRNSRTLSY